MVKRHMLLMVPYRFFDLILNFNRYVPSIQTENLLLQDRRAMLQQDKHSLRDIDWCHCYLNIDWPSCVNVKAYRAALEHN